MDLFENEPVRPIPRTCPCCATDYLTCNCAAYTDGCERCVLHCGCPVCLSSVAKLRRMIAKIAADKKAKLEKLTHHHLREAS